MAYKKGGYIHKTKSKSKKTMKSKSKSKSKSRSVRSSKTQRNGSNVSKVAKIHVSQITLKEKK